MISVGPKSSQWRKLRLAMNMWWMSIGRRDDLRLRVLVGQPLPELVLTFSCCVLHARCVHWSRSLASLIFYISQLVTSISSPGKLIPDLLGASPCPRGSVGAQQLPHFKNIWMLHHSDHCTSHAHSPIHDGTFPLASQLHHGSSRSRFHCGETRRDLYPGQT
jgi:hypothetical protein